MKFTLWLTLPASAVGFWVGENHHLIAGAGGALLAGLGVNKIRKVAVGKKAPKKSLDLLS